MKASQEESAGLWWPRLTPMNLGLVPVDVLESVYVILHHVAPVVHAEPANICAVARCDSSSASSSGRRAFAWQVGCRNEGPRNRGGCSQPPRARADAPGHAAWRHGLHGAALSRRDSHDAAIPKKAGATPALQRLHP